MVAAQEATGLPRPRLLAVLAGFPNLLGVSSRQLASKWARLQEYGGWPGACKEAHGHVMGVRGVCCM